jgi:hypothetical protein
LSGPARGNPICASSAAKRGSACSSGLSTIESAPWGKDRFDGRLARHADHVAALELGEQAHGVTVRDG